MEPFEKLLGRNCAKNAPLSRHTSFRTGGPADYLLSPTSQEDLAACIRICRQNAIPYMVLGNMSNLVVSDRGVEGAVITTRKIKGLKVDGTSITASCGVSLTEAAEAAAKNSLTGLEFASGIPGSVGGALVMNAGAYEHEMKDVVSRAGALGSDDECKPKEYVPEELGLAYRTSIFQSNGETVTWVAFALQKGDKQAIRAKMKELNDLRREKQPLEYPSAGSVFRRPEGHYVGELIEGCGLKGVRKGGAMVSDKHAGFIINFDKATSDDILELIQFIQYAVYEKKGVRLNTELKIIGRP